ncbi:zinc-binding protein A33-like [Pholidichthys leucotaenia]
MASRSEEDLSCPVCKDIFREPVVLSCSHSFCKNCVKNWWSAKPTQECPVCKRRSSKSEPLLNRVLKNLCESYLQEKEKRSSDALCSLHSEKLKLFCLDHQQPVCLICRDSEKHIHHRFRPIDEAARQYRKNLQKILELAKCKLTLSTVAKFRIDDTANCMKVQAQNTVRLIKEQFKRLHQFLTEEEDARLAELKEEIEMKIRVMNEKSEAVSREIAALTNTIRATEEELGMKDVLFLQNYKATVGRVENSSVLKDFKQSSGALIDQAKHLGNLRFNIWNKMKNLVSYMPVILDPNTAGTDIILSEDLNSVKRGEEKLILPDNPERFDVNVSSVLGSEGFDSGIQSWDVEVGNSRDWAVGVIAESAPRKGKVLSGFLEIVSLEGKYFFWSPPAPPCALTVEEKVRRIRVTLDWDKGKLSFYDLDNNKYIHRFNHKFTEKMFPGFHNGDTAPVRVLPVSMSVTTDEKCNQSK